MANLSQIVQPSNVATATNTQTLTNKTISFVDNTLTGVASTSTAQTLTNKTLDAGTQFTGDALARLQAVALSF